MLPEADLKWNIIRTITIATLISTTLNQIVEQDPPVPYIPDDGDGGHCEELAREGPLEKYLQPDDLISGKYDDYSSNPDNLCARECRKNEPPKICYYRFTVERYHSMGLACKTCPNSTADCNHPQCVTADGYERMIITVNRRMPGPSIQVCQNDLVVVDVKNKMMGTGITVHWHGIRQLGTPFMDGVPMVTQCPIVDSQIFRYYFQPNVPGLFFWHSHEALQKVDGFLGSLVVRRPVSEDPNGDRYDFDLPSHVILIQDWMHETADALFPGLRTRRVGQHADVYLINGRGIFMENGQRYLNTPVSTFNIRSGNDYVFRIIGGTCLSCPFRFQIESHRLMIIGTDGRDVEPRVVDSIVLGAGERYSVVVRGKSANRLSKQNYWIHVNGTGICLTDPVIPSQVGILRYSDAPNSTPTPLSAPLNPGSVMGEANSRCQGTRDCYIHLVGAEDVPLSIKQPDVDYRIIMGLDFISFPNPDDFFKEGVYRPFFDPGAQMAFTGTINGIAHAPSPVPLLTQLEDVPRCLYCSTDQPFSEWYTLKECLHLFRVIQYPSVVEIIYVDIDRVGNNTPTGMTHPIHLHGYDQYLIDQGVFSTNNIQRELTNLINRLKNNTNIPEKPIMKDTFLVAKSGYVVIRIVADNPGFWIVHCHFAYHAEVGMVAVLQVGDNSDHSTAPTGFPTCNNFLPKPERNSN
ncbi:uncharacterized protein LOC142324284 [Lycorma delicatula]|uniref:uncharacterized protein LOC142324284 n=1 Tax=Lycorma delicatula TaxID=130591 RepID=UPI003F518352